MNVLKKYSKILHIKIPKNGTHSINKILDYKNKDWHRTNFLDEKSNTKYTFDHDTFSSLKQNNYSFIDENVFVFAVCRNPYTRFFSQYEHLIRSYPVYHNKYFSDFVKDVKYQKIHPVYTEPQTSWLSVDGGIFSSIDLNYQDVSNVYIKSKFARDLKESHNISLIDDRIDKIYKIENIQEFEIDFSVKLTNNNYSTYSIKRYINFFTEEIKEFVAKKYKEDFYNFGYDLSFEKSIDDLKNQRKRLLLYY